MVIIELVSTQIDYFPKNSIFFFFLIAATEVEVEESHGQAIFAPLFIVALTFFFILKFLISRQEESSSSGKACTESQEFQ